MSLEDYKNRRWEVVEYNPQWAEIFELEKEKIKSVFGDNALAIEHIGSTAVPGLESKPIIDITVLISSRKNANQYIVPLAEIGYVYDEPVSSSERHFFRKYGEVSYHLSIAYQDKGTFWQRQIFFRDYLRNNTNAREEYSILKKKLIKEDPSSRHSYIQGKDEFIQKILKLSEMDLPKS